MGRLTGVAFELLGGGEAKLATGIERAGAHRVVRALLDDLVDHLEGDLVAQPAYVAVEVVRDLVERRALDVRRDEHFEGLLGLLGRAAARVADDPGQERNRVVGAGVFVGRFPEARNEGLGVVRTPHRHRDGGLFASLLGLAHGLAGRGDLGAKLTIVLDLRFAKLGHQLVEALLVRRLIGLLGLGRLIELRAHTRRPAAEETEAE
jgi:hypothetical protein